MGGELNRVGGEVDHHRQFAAPAVAEHVLRSGKPGQGAIGQGGLGAAQPRGAARSFSRIVLDLTPSSSWSTRTQTLSVQGSTDGSSFSTIVGPATYTFNPSAGNTVTSTFPSASYRYVRLNFTANTGWPAGQVSEFQVWAS
jgi:hypothetical protein